MNLRGLLQRHPLVSYFVLAFVIAWGLCLIFLGPIPKPAAQVGMSDILLLFISMLLGPSIAGLTMTAVTGGRKALRDLFSRINHWRVSGWYAALSIFPVLILAVLLGLSLTASPVFSPIFMPSALVIGLLAGAFEELGWSGFAYPRLREKFGWVSAALILGALWTLWHILPDFLGAFSLRGASWLPHFGGFVLAMMGVRFIISWVYNHTKSLLLAQLMHASSTGFLAVLVPSALTPVQDTLVYYVYAAVLAVVVLVLVVTEKRTSPQ
jgi:membrane protease YdiL (CAAX protease family)